MRNVRDVKCESNERIVETHRDTGSWQEQVTPPDGGQLVLQRQMRPLLEVNHLPGSQDHPAAPVLAGENQQLIGPLRLIVTNIPRDDLGSTGRCHHHWFVAAMAQTGSAAIDVIGRGSGHDPFQRHASSLHGCLFVFGAAEGVRSGRQRGWRIGVFDDNWRSHTQGGRHWGYVQFPQIRG